MLCYTMNSTIVTGHNQRFIIRSLIPYKTCQCDIQVEKIPTANRYHNHHCYECVTKSLMLISMFHFPEIIIIITQIERKPFVSRTKNTSHNNRNRTDVKLWNEKCTNMKIISSGSDNHLERVKHGNISKWKRWRRRRGEKYISYLKPEKYRKHMTVKCRYHF